MTLLLMVKSLLLMVKSSIFIHVHDFSLCNQAAIVRAGAVSPLVERLHGDMMKAEMDRTWCGLRLEPEQPPKRWKTMCETWKWWGEYCQFVQKLLYLCGSFLCSYRTCDVLAASMIPHIPGAQEIRVSPLIHIMRLCLDVSWRGQT